MCLTSSDAESHATVAPRVAGSRRAHRRAHSSRRIATLSNCRWKLETKTETGFRKKSTAAVAPRRPPPPRRYEHGRRQRVHDEQEGAEHGAERAADPARDRVEREEHVGPDGRVVVPRGLEVQGAAPAQDRDRAGEGLDVVVSGERAQQQQARRQGREHAGDEDHAGRAHPPPTSARPPARASRSPRFRRARAAASFASARTGTRSRCARASRAELRQQRRSRRRPRASRPGSPEERRLRPALDLRVDRVDLGAAHRARGSSDAGPRRRRAPATRASRRASAASSGSRASRTRAPPPAGRRADRTRVSEV